MDLKVWSISKPHYDLKNMDLKVWIIPWYRSIILVKNHSSMDSLYFDIVPWHRSLTSFPDIIPPDIIHSKMAIDKVSKQHSVIPAKPANYVSRLFPHSGNQQSIKASKVRRHRSIIPRHDPFQVGSQKVNNLASQQDIPTRFHSGTVPSQYCSNGLILIDCLQTCLGNLIDDMVCCLGNLTGTLAVVWKTWLWERFDCGSGLDVNLVNFWHGELLFGESLSGESLNYEMVELLNAVDP